LYRTYLRTNRLIRIRIATGLRTWVRDRARQCINWALLAHERDYQAGYVAAPAEAAA
jgi:hypothetical protein